MFRPRPGGWRGGGMDAVSRAQIVWAETKDLRVPAGGGPGAPFGLGPAAAALAPPAGQSVSRLSPLPAGRARAIACSSLQMRPHARLPPTRTVQQHSMPPRALGSPPPPVLASV